MAMGGRRATVRARRARLIVGAAAPSLVVGAAQVGATIRVAVTAANAGGSATATSPPTGAVPVPPAPANTGLPKITGTAKVGQTLTASPGSWSNGPTSYAYQWQDCNTTGAGCVAIVAATSSSYVLGSAQAGATVRVAVTAANAGGSATATSTPTAVILAVPADTVLPAITGTAVVSQTLTATAGTWANAPTSYAYQWQRCSPTGTASAAMAGATGSTYTLVAADDNSTLVVAVTATNPAGSTTAVSNATGLVIGVPAVTVLPAVTGAAVVGQALTVSAGSWTDSPTSYGYAWQDCNPAGVACTTIAGATTAGYTLAAGDAGSTIRVAVTATNPAGSATATSADTATVIGVPAATVLPAISGPAVVGATLAATAGTWTNQPTHVAYTWRDCDPAGKSCTPIAGATAATYTTTTTDAGDSIEVTVTATNPAGTASAVSAPTPTILAAPTDIALPAISGTAAVGSTLTVSNGTWTNNPTGYRYTWSDCDPSGAVCTPIAGAATDTYTLATSDAGDTIQAAVAATNPAGSTTAVTPPSPVVVAAPQNTTLPTVVGTYTQGSTLTAAPGAWTGNPTGYRYAWSDCPAAGGACTPIAGAATVTYTLTASDVGDTVEASVTATNPAGSATATSTPTGVIYPRPPTNTTPPTITPAAANPATGHTLTAAPGTWTNNPTSYSYTWSDCPAGSGACTPIAGATSSTYTPAAGDIGDQLQVTVTATNPGGSNQAISASTAVVVGALTASFTATPGAGGSSLDVAFDAGASSDLLAGATVTGYAWEFGDATTATGETTTHTYSTFGTYTATLTVTDSTGATATRTATVAVAPQAPVAVAAAGRVPGAPAYQEILFALGSTDPNPGATLTSYTWDFGDGSTGSGEEAAHSYPIGTFTATLTVTDSLGLTATATTAVTVAANPPVAVITPTTATAGAGPMTVGFDASKSVDSNLGGTITSYAWDFGDGTTATGKTVSHAYSFGTYTATLTVTDSLGLTATTTEPVDATVADASFTASATTGSSPLTVDFTTAAPAASYIWNFGDGTTATGATVAHTYGPGTFTATLTVTNASGVTATQSQPITVDPSAPRASFSADRIPGVEPAQVSFDATGSVNTDPGGTLSYGWDFGDGSTGTGATLSHTYGPGTYTATLTVISSFGPTATASKTFTVADGPPEVILTTSATVGNSPLTVSFDASGSADPNPGGSIVSYTWDFGDGTTGTGATVVHTYGPGSFTATVTETNLEGVTATKSVPVVVAASAPRASFSADRIPGVEPAQVSFDATGSVNTDPGGTLSYGWDFGDGSTGTGATLSHTYGPGTYTATLTVTSSFGPTAAASKTFTVADGPPEVILTTSATVGNSPLTVSFDASGSADPNPGGSIVSYTWDFGDGTTGTGATVVHTYGPGSFTATVTETNLEGVTATKSVPVGVAAATPTAAIAPTSETGVTSLTVDLDGSGSTDPNPGGTITAYAWNFGDGTNGTGPTVTHTYGVGAYTATLAVTDNFGQSATIQTTINVYPTVPPVAAFSVAPTTTAVYCGNAGCGATEDFDDTASVPAPTATTGSVTYGWDFGDGTSDQTTNGPDATVEQHTYATAGTYTVTLTVADQAGRTSAVSHQVTIDTPPSPVITATNSTGPGPLTLNLDATGSTDPNPGASITSYTWDFGDGTPAGTGPTVSHTYTTPGFYTVTLVVGDSAGLKASTTTSIEVYGPLPGLFISATPTTGPGPLTVSLDAPDIFLLPSSAGPDTYTWNLGDNTTATGANVTHTYTTPGTYTVTLTESDTLAQTATASTTITVAGPRPTAKLALFNNTGPGPLTVLFAPQGQILPGGSSGDALIEQINYGDGTSQKWAATAAGEVSQSGPTYFCTTIAGCGYFFNHTYSTAGTYVASLTVTEFAADGVADRGAATATGVVTVQGAIATVAGSGPTQNPGASLPVEGDSTGDGGPAEAATFTPVSVATYGGNVYFDDQVNDQDIDPGSYKVHEVNPGGVMTNVAGGGTFPEGFEGGRFSGDGGPATQATLDAPAAIAFDSHGNVYIADAANNRIREVNAATGIITTVAGTDDDLVAGDPASFVGYSGDGGPATAAHLDNPQGVAVDAAGNIYISDTDNDRIREVEAATGIITTLAAGPLIDGAVLFDPQGLAVDAAGNIYVACGSGTVDKVTPAGVVTVVAGENLTGAGPVADYNGDGIPATQAALADPSAVAVDAAGNLYIADTYNNRIRRVDAATGIITTVAGTGAATEAPGGGPSDGGGEIGDGAAPTNATLDQPTGIALGSNGELYIADQGDNRIREVFTGNCAAPAGPGVDWYGCNLTGANLTGADLARRQPHQHRPQRHHRRSTPSAASTSPSSTSPASTSPAPTSPAPTSPTSISPTPTWLTPTSPTPTSLAPTSPTPTSPAPTSPVSIGPATTWPPPTCPTPPASTPPTNKASPRSTCPASTSPAPNSSDSTSPATTSPTPTSPALISVMPSSPGRHLPT